MEPQRGKGSGNAPGGSVCWRFSSALAILYKVAGNQKSYALLYVHSFRVISQKCRRAEDTNRLQYLRLQAGLLQRQVAERIGVSESAYRDVELGRSGRLPADVVDRLAALYQVPATDLLDEYGWFLYEGQADQIRRARKRLGVTRREFAKQAGVGESSVKAWETGKKEVSRKSWKKLKKLLI